MRGTMELLLTDDEVVAATIQRGRTWPYPLPTVALDADELLSAGARGARSLLVRGLARTDDSSLVVDKAISSLIDRITESTERVFAYVGDLANPAALAGSSTYLYQASEAAESAVLDLVSSSGVHDLRELTRAEGIELFLAAIENVFNAGFRGDSADREPTLFASSGSGSGAVAVVQGRVTFGTLGTSDGEATFTEESSTDRWDSLLVADALGFSPANASSSVAVDGSGD